MALSISPISSRRSRPAAVWPSICSFSSRSLSISLCMATMGFVMVPLKNTTITATTTAAIAIVMIKYSMILLVSSWYTETGIATMILPTSLETVVRYRFMPS